MGVLGYPTRPSLAVVHTACFRHHLSLKALISFGETWQPGGVGPLNSYDYLWWLIFLSWGFTECSRLTRNEAGWAFDMTTTWVTKTPIVFDTPNGPKEWWFDLYSGILPENDPTLQLTWTSNEIFKTMQSLTICHRVFSTSSLMSGFFLTPIIFCSRYCRRIFVVDLGTDSAICSLNSPNCQTPRSVNHQCS